MGAEGGTTAPGGGDDAAAGKVRVLHTEGGAPYVICESRLPFRNPTAPRPPLKPQLVVSQLNVDLGQTFITRKNQTLLWVLKFLDGVFVQWWESAFFKFWNLVPLKFRRQLTFRSWWVYLRLHKLLLGRSTGLHPSQSPEYHALTSLAWWSRFFPATPRRMRFSLSQLHVCMPHEVQWHKNVVKVDEAAPGVEEPRRTSSGSYPARVRGLYLRHNQELAEEGGNEPSEWAVFWIFGGAYLAGDAVGNSAAADWFGHRLGMDVFVPQFRLAPEANIHEVLWDVVVAYRWFCARVKDPSKILLLGISSGAAIGVRLMQFISEYRRGLRPLQPTIIEPLLQGQGMVMPQAAVLFGPYVDFTTEDPGTDKNGSFHHYSRLDLVVNEAVQEYGLPYIEKFIPDGCSKEEYSPVYRDMQGLPPLCVVVSEHEAVYDMTIELVNRARTEGVEVTLGVWKYMCHVFSFLFAFVPEGRLSMEFVLDWMLKKKQEKDTKASGLIGDSSTAEKTDG